MNCIVFPYHVEGGPSRWDNTRCDQKATHPRLNIPAIPLKAVSLCTSGLLLTHWVPCSDHFVVSAVFFAHKNLNFCVKLTNLFGWTSSLLMSWVSSYKKMQYIRSQPTPGACFSLVFPVLTHLREKNMVYFNIATHSALKTVLLAVPMQTLYNTS